MERKPLFNLMKSAKVANQQKSKESTAKSQRGEQKSAIQTKIEVRTLLNENKQSKREQKPVNSSLINRIFTVPILHQPAQTPYDKKLQDLVE